MTSPEIVETVRELLTAKFHTLTTEITRVPAARCRQSPQRISNGFLGVLSGEIFFNLQLFTPVSI